MASQTLSHLFLLIEFFYAPWHSQVRRVRTTTYTHVSHMPKKRPESECGHSGSSSRILSGGARGVLGGAPLRWKEAALRQALRQALKLPATASFSPPEISVQVIRAYRLWKKKSSKLNTWSLCWRASIWKKVEKKFDLNLFEQVNSCCTSGPPTIKPSVTSQPGVGVKDNCSRPVIWTLPYAPILVLLAFIGAYF